MTPDETGAYVPTVPPKVRAGVYYSGVFVAFASFITAGAAAVLMEDASAVVTIAGLVGTGWGGVAAALGVAYRPTK